VALAITSMVALAFLVPLSLLLKQIVHERAVADARLQASAMVAVLAVTTDRSALAQAAASTEAGVGGRLAVYPPDGDAIGTRHADEPTVRAVEASRTTAVRTVAGGLSYLQPVAVQGGRIAVVEVFVPDAALTHGVRPAWLALAGVALTLVAGSVAVADRLGARMVRSTRGLARAARRLGQDDLAVRVVPGGPPEIAEVGRAFNAMADRMVGLLRSERELAADLSHRLRTPLTALRLELDNGGDQLDAERLRQAVTILSGEVDGIIRATREPLSARPAEHCDLTDVLADRLAFWSVLAEDHGRPWTVVGSAEPLWVAVRRADAEAAIDALIGNVFHHTPEGTPFRAGVVGSALVVEDDGPGIASPQDALRRGASFGGSTGLGLDIAQRFAADAGGELVIGRGPRGGTRVEISLGRPES
jgi:signal transduction histidine kinase